MKINPSLFHKTLSSSKRDSSSAVPVRDIVGHQGFEGGSHLSVKGWGPVDLGACIHEKWSLISRPSVLPRPWCF